MHPSTRSLAVLALSLGCGIGGYFLGKSQTEAVTQMASTSGGAVKPPIYPRMATQSLDPVKLRAALDRETSPLARFKLALANLEAWMDKSPLEAMNWLAAQPPSARRDEVIRQALQQFASLDAKGAADWAMANLSGIELNNNLILIAESWAEQNGSEAADWFLARPATQQRDGAIENIFFSWASNEPAAALDYMKSHDLGDLAPTLRRAAYAGWVKTEPEAAVTASLASSRASKNPDQFANTLANWATMDLESSAQWLSKNLQPGPERSAAAMELGTIFGQESPADGVAWLPKLAAGAERDAAAGSLVTSWARSSPAEAAGWLATQTTATVSPDAIAGVAHNFVMKNPVAFETWRASLPPGATKDAVATVAAVPERE